jgi:16S rRNA (uracil1498-N3)-methyltransferase
VTDPLFLSETLPLPLPDVGDRVALAGPEARHAAVVRRIRIGEHVLISDGRGRGVRGRVTSVDPHRLVAEVLDQVLLTEPDRRYVVAQALAKGDRSELAVEMLTEIGVAEIVPWQAARSIVRWSGDRAEKSRAKWQATAREATKQSRRLRIPVVAEAASTAQLADRVSQADLALVLHEAAADQLTDVELPTAGTVLIIVGPEGGLDDAELAALTAAGARPVLISDGVLRTSTAGLVACAALMAR